MPRSLSRQSENARTEQVKQRDNRAPRKLPRHPARKPVLFDSGIPSNFYVGAPIYVIDPFTHKLSQFCTNEHYFQAYKEYHALHGTKKGFYAIAGAAYPDGRPNPGLAKRLGKQVNFTNQDKLRWDLFVAPEIMYRINLAKFSQNEHCKEWLRTTGRRLLVEHRKDPIWGDNLDGTGKNMLGKTLMLVRTHIFE